MNTFPIRHVIALIAILALGSAGCAAGAGRPVTPAPAAAAVAEAPASPAQPEPPAPARPSVKSLLVSPIAEEPQAGREPISFSVKNVEIRDVLLGLSRMTATNIVFEQDIAGKVSVDLKDVTIDEALKDLLTPMGLEFTREGRTIQVTKQKVQTRIFSLNYIPTRRKGESQVYATSSSAAAAAGGATAAATPGGAAAGEEKVGFSRVKGEDATNLWDDVKTTLERLLSPQGRYGINPMAGLVVVTDLPAQLDRIAKYVEAVEISVRRQVLIQAEILEITLTEDFEYGIDFTGLTRSGTYKGLESGLTAGGPAKTIFSQLLNPRSGIFNIGLADGTVAMMLDLLQKEGKLRVLSRPSVSTLNNQKAIIKVATDDVFFETTVTIPQTGPAQTTVTSTSVTIGVVLSVTPQIASDGFIVMDIHPIVTDSALTRTFSSGDVTASRPVVDVRETNTVLRVRDGESIVIAGLMKTKADKQVRRVPFLSRIPVLGLLFQQLDESNQNTELVIKITPRIVAAGTR